jgi:hypothetical protein
MILAVLAVVITLLAFQGIIIFMQARRIKACEAKLEDSDVSIRRLNNRVIGEQYPIKGTLPLA